MYSDQPSLEMAEDDDEEEEEEEMPTTLEEALSLLGLDSLINVFLKEQIDFDSLVGGPHTASTPPSSSLPCS